MGKRILVLISILSLLVTGSVFAQSTTAGSLTGQVMDASGAALPGVTVELTGTAMQGTRTAVTDSTGGYRFLNVPPGEGYKVTATLSGFAPVSKTIARVYLGQDSKVDLTLKAAVSEAITVTAEAPLVDVSKTTTGVNVTARQFESLPTQRSFQQLTTLAPGVNMDMGSSRSNQLGNSPSVGASSAPENNYIIDGLSTTDARYGTSGTNLTMNFVEEVQVMTGGYSAEFGRSTGGVFNVITKSGGNDLAGDVFGYISDSSWSSDRVNRYAKGTEFNADVVDSTDFGASLGGPIMRDRLWFFGAVNPSKRTTDIGGSHPLIGDNPTEFDQDTFNYAGKLTFAANANHNFVATAFGDPTTQEGWLIRGLNAPPADEAAANRKADVGSNNFNLRYNGIISQNWLVEANVGTHKRDNTLRAANATSAAIPRQIDETVGGGYNRGGFNRIVDEESTRNAWALKSSNFIGRHEFRYGLDVENNEYVADTHETWYRYLGDPTANSRFRGECAGITCTRMEERIYSVDGSGETANEAAFLQDQWKVMPNLQLNLGVRWERQRMGSGRGVALATDPDQINTGNYTQVDEYTLDNNWAPRLGFVWDPKNNGRSKVYGYVGRFFEAVPLDLNIRALNGEDYIISEYQHLPGAPSYWYNPSGNPVPSAVRSGAVGAVTENGWTKIRARNLTAATLTPLSADLKAQYQDEYILGGEYQFGDVWSAGVRLVDRELKRVIEDFGVFTDPTDPTALTGYAIANPGEGVLGEGYEKPKRYYRAAEFTVQRAFRDNWQLMASYVYAQAKGNYEGLFMSGYEQLDPNITALYDLPEFLANSNGKLRADRPINFKIHSSYRFPFGLTVSEGFFYNSGIPISALGPDELNGYGDGTIFRQARGSAGRTPNYWNMDFHADYVLPFFRGGDRGLSLIVDIFNATNNDEVIEVDQDQVFQAQSAAETKADGSSVYFGTPTLRQSPRTVQLGAKFTF
jgi:outer membrane receptor protein involved in Fe transport